MKFTEEDFKRINNAVKIAESKTSGEIATAIIKESSDYAFYELFFSLIVGGIYFIVLTIFSGRIEGFISSLFWGTTGFHFMIFTGVSLFLVIGLSYLIANLPGVDRLIIPKKIMEQRVNNRALRYFIESGTCYTKDRTGVLIFISELERKVILLADKGINDKIPQERWDGIVAEIILGIKGKMVVDSIVSAVIECGNILTDHFPIQSDDVNELSDDIRILKE
ncbi:MAG: TPM domain-containing protein [Spirochaetales bacterium]|nr:TPM domain-containing protein [Spirochaetales bacterium]